MLPNTLSSWVVWFYDTFIAPLIDICKNIDILGYTFFEWLMSFAIVSMAIHFIKDLFGADDRKD